MAAGGGLTVRFEVSDLKAVAKEMRRWDHDMPKAMRAANKAIAEGLHRRVVNAAPPEFQRALRAGSTPLEVQLRIGVRPPRAIAEFMGAKRRTGWYAAPRYAASTGRQFRPWVGNQWVPGERNGAPYYIGLPIDRAMPDVEDAYLAMLEAMWTRAMQKRTATLSYVEAVVRGEM